MQDIDKLRSRMDKITFDILRLLKERNDVAKEIGSIKNKMGLGMTNENRENQLRVNVLSLCKEIGLDEKAGLTMLNFLLNESIKIQSSNMPNHLSIFRKAKLLERQGKKIIHMEVGEPDFNPPDIVKKALSEAYDKGYTKYGDSKGMTEFREALSTHVTEKFGGRATLENILVSPGARFSVFLAISTILNPGNEIIVIEPSWPAYKENALNSGVKVRTIQTSLEGSWEPQINEIENTINKNTKMIVLNYPNNPTGKILPEKLLDDIMDLSIKNGLYVLSDEIYSSYAFKAWKSALSYEYEKTIVTQSFSKSHAMTGFRIGYAVSNPQTIDKMSRLQSLSMTNVSEPIQYAAMRSLEADTTDNTKKMESRLQMLVRKGKKMGIDSMEPDGAMYLFARSSKPSFDSIEFTNKLLDYGVAVAPGDGFGNYKQFIRISACQPEEILNRGMEIIEEVMEKEK